MAKIRISFVLLLITFVLLVVGCTSKEHRVQEFISDGKKYIQKGEYKKAILEFKNALQLDPKNVKAMFYIGKAYLGIKEYRKAYSFFYNAVKLDPNFDEAKIELASLLLLARKSDDALNYLNSVNNLDKYEPKISILKAKAYFFKKKYKDAIDILLKIRGVQTNKEAQILLCFCYRNINDFNKMIECVRNWRNIDPKDVRSYLYLAQYFAEKGDKDRLLKELDAMVKNNPSPNVKLIYAISLEKFGFKKKAETVFSSLPDEVLFLKEKAKFYFRNKKIKKAEDILKKIIKKNPKDITSVTLLSKIYFLTKRPDLAYKEIDKTISILEKKEEIHKLLVLKAQFKAQQGMLKEAKKICKQVLKEDQANIDAHFLLGKILFFEGAFDKAEIHLSQVVTADPFNKEAQILLARCEFLNKKPAIAEDILKKALKNMPKDTQLRLELVRLYLLKKEYGNAISTLDEGLSKSPKNVLFLKTKGEIEIFRGNYKKAKSDFEKIINIVPESAIGYVELAKLYASKKDYDKALYYLKEAYKKKDGRNVFSIIIDIYLRNKDIESAIKFCKTEIDKNPRFSLPYYFLGRLYLFKKDFEKAKTFFKKAISLSPNWQDPYKGLAVVYINEGKIDKAIGELENSFRRRPSISIGMALVTLYKHKRDFNKAEQIYKTLLKIHPNNTIILNNLAYFYAQYFSDSGKLKEARELIAKALSINPNNPDFLDTAAWIEYKLKNYNVAWAYIKDAVSRSEKDIIKLHAAMISYELKELDEAKRFLKDILNSKDPEIREKALKLRDKLLSSVSHSSAND